MEILQCIEGRHSVRAYRPDPVGQKLIEELVDAAGKAPSWKNAQPTRYTALEDRAALDRIAALLPEYNARIVKSAPALVAVSAVKKRSGYERDGSPSTVFGDGYTFFDCGVAVQTFCLAAWARGLGTVIMGIFAQQPCREAFSIPEDEELIALVALGYPAGEAGQPPKKDHGRLLRYLG